MREGQSLIEVLIGVGVGALFIIGAAAAIAPALRTNQAVTQVQTKTELGDELIQNVKAWAAGNWNNVLALATGTANSYYLNTATSSFTVASGSQSVVVGSTTYLRSFYLSDVYRDINGKITTTISGNYYDPSTKQVTATVSSSTYTFFLTRNANSVFDQTSWAGGSGQNNPITLVGTSYYAGNSISVSATGSIQLSGTGGNSCVL
jgi:hypothetical protein